MTTSPIFVWAGKLNDQVKVQDHATSLILEALNHETSRLWWERLSDVGWLCTGPGRSWRHHLPPEGALAIPSSPDQKTSRPLGFLKNWKPDLFCNNIAAEKLCEFWIANRSRVKIFLTKSFQGRLPRTYYTPPACALHNKLSLTWKEPLELGSWVFIASQPGLWASLLLSRWADHSPELHPYLWPGSRPALLAAVNLCSSNSGNLCVPTTIFNLKDSTEQSVPRLFDQSGDSLVKICKIWTELSTFSCCSDLKVGMATFVRRDLD